MLKIQANITNTPITMIRKLLIINQQFVAFSANDSMILLFEKSDDEYMQSISAAGIPVLPIDEF